MAERVTVVRSMINYLLFITLHLNSFSTVFLFDLNDIGIPGIFNKCTMGRAIKNGFFNIPLPQCIPKTDLLAPFVIVGDQAFPLLVNLMRPFPENQSIGNNEKEEFNYRLSRARRVSENAFGISTSLFTIFTKPFDVRCDETRNNLIFSTCIIW